MYLNPSKGTLSQTLFLYPTWRIAFIMLLVWLSSKQYFLLVRYRHTAVHLPLRGGRGLTGVLFLPIREYNNVRRRVICSIKAKSTNRLQWPVLKSATDLFKKPMKLLQRQRIVFHFPVAIFSPFYKPTQKRLFSNPTVKRRYSLCYSQHSTNRQLRATPFSDTGCQSTDVTKHLSPIVYYWWCS